MKAAGEMENGSSSEEVLGGRILIVDDEEKNRAVFRDTLIARGYEVEEADNGADALIMANAAPPDVVLLDVMMPRMDGFEVCRRMKNNPNLAQVAVIIVSALSDRKERLIGIEAGANDFLLKPIDMQDAILRLRNAVQNKRLYDRLQKSHRELESLQKLRDDLTHMVVHDMRSPLTTMIGYLDLLSSSEADLAADEARDFLSRVRASADLIKQMVNSLLDISRLEAGKMPLDRRPFRFDLLVNEIMREFGGIVGSRRFIKALPPDLLPIEADAKLVRRILSNLLDNAFCVTPEAGLVEVGAAVENKHVRIHVADSGPGIPPEYKESVFEKFAQVEGGKKAPSTGLGLAFCKLAVERHQGAIGIDDRPGGGSIFWFTLPIAQ